MCLYIYTFAFVCFSTHIMAGMEKLDFPGKIEVFYYDKVQTSFYSKPLQKVTVSDKLLYVIPGVITPSIHSALFLEHTQIYAGEEVLDIGTGSGVQGIFAADFARKVVSTDISSIAVKNAEINVKLHRLEKIVEVREGDLFGPINRDERFDVVLFNIDPPSTKEELGLWKVHERFFEEVGTYLKPSGRIYYQGTAMNYIPRVRQMAMKNKFRIMKLDMLTSVSKNQEPYVLLIQRY